MAFFGLIPNRAEEERKRQRRAAWVQEANAMIANQNLMISRARSFERENADELAMADIEGRKRMTFSWAPRPLLGA